MENVPAGVLQGTKLGPWLFVLMIDDIDTTNTNNLKWNHHIEEIIKKVPPGCTS
jgi:hypothetical protein